MTSDRIILKPGEELRILKGHPWVYDNEIETTITTKPDGILLPGTVADVESSNKKYLGRAFVNPHSKIRARIFSRSKEGVDKGFFKRRFREAINRRRLTYNLNIESARLIFGEADFLPGLVVDRYVGHEVGNEEQRASWLSVQFLTAAMDVRRDEIVEALIDVLSDDIGKPLGIMERSEARVRELEGLPIQSNVIYGSIPEEGIVIQENGLRFFVNISGGQKTGHFLDQKRNRRLAASFAQNRRCLDVCCNTGGFAINAASSGASSVIALDISTQALDAVKYNASLNGVSNKITVLEADIFDSLRLMEKKGETFDWIVLDPPAFAKTKKSLTGALRGYKEINLRAMNLLEKNGILITCSCSAALREEEFKSLITDAAFDAGKRLQRLSFTYQAEDHPILEGFDESLYLKCGIYRILT